MILAFRFENLDYSWYLLILVVGLAFLWFLYKKLSKSFGFYANNSMGGNTFEIKKWRTKHLFIIAGLCLCILALLNPQLGKEKTTVRADGADVYIALDISNSMYATDVSPSRLARAKRLCSSIIDELKGNRVGLIFFAGGAYLQMPISPDLATAKTLIDGANPSQAGNQGTALKDALELADKTFETNSNKNKAIIVVTDGESHDENAASKAKEISSKGTTLISIGIGTESGGNILLPEGGELFDEKGSIVVSKLNKELIKSMGKENSFFVEGNNEDPSKNIIKIIQNLAGGPVKTDAYEQARSLFQLPLALGLILMSLGFFYNTFSTNKGMKSLSLLFIFFILSNNLCSQGRPNTVPSIDYTRLMIEGNKMYNNKDYEGAQRYFEEAAKSTEKPHGPTYNKGNTMYKQQKYNEAITEYDKAFEQAQSSQEKAYSLYNKGNALFNAQDFGNAVNAYKDALKYTPSDQQIIQDLAKAKLKLKQQQKQEQQKKDQEKQDQQKNKDDQQKNQNQENQQQNKDQNQEQQPQNGDKQNMTKEELQRMLQMIDNKEREVQQKLKRTNGRTKKNSKDW